MPRRGLRAPEARARPLRDLCRCPRAAQLAVAPAAWGKFALCAKLRSVRALVPSGRQEDMGLLVLRGGLESCCLSREHIVTMGGGPQAVVIAACMSRRAGSRRLAKLGASELVTVFGRGSVGLSSRGVDTGDRYSSSGSASDLVGSVLSRRQCNRALRLPGERT